MEDNQWRGLCQSGRKGCSLTLLLGNSPRPRPRLVFRGFEDEDEDEQEPALAAICNRVKLHPGARLSHNSAPICFPGEDGFSWTGR